MTVGPGSTLSRFRILAKIGEGGMGVVYRAEDEKLRRPVALKVLPPHLVANEERRLRFLREARTAAAINHTNIATIYEVNEADGIVFIAMEWIEGRTMRAVMGGKPMSIKEALRIALEMSEGLAKAHGAHVIHRDLKPENVKVTPDGHVKILDFGLAKLLQEKPVSSETELSKLSTISEELTIQGKIFGTPAYMSPEQARGQVVDARSDLFSFGTMLYEMITGRRPFQGDTATDMLSSIIREEPIAPSLIRDTVPHELDRIVAECLEKDPRDRYQHTDQLAVDLRKLKRTTDSSVQVVRTPSGSGAAAPEKLTAARRGPRKLLVRSIVSVMGIVALAGGYWAWRMINDSSTAVQATFSRVTSWPGEEAWPSLSPDGRSVVFTSSAAGNPDIYLLRVGGSKAINLTKDCSSSDTHPAFSPDGERIVFRSERDGGGIFVMGATGESPKRLSNSGYNPAWSPDGQEIVWATEAVGHPASRAGISQLYTLDLGTGQERKLFAGDAVQPQWSPHGHRIAFWAWAVDGAERDIWTVPAQGGHPVQVTVNPALDWNPAWSANGGHLFFLSDRGGSMNIWRVPIDEASGKVLGRPEPITAPTSYAAHLSVSRDGRRIAYLAYIGKSNIQRVPFDPVGGVPENDPVWVTQGSRELVRPDVSPDGEWLLFKTTAIEQEDIFIVHRDGSGLRQLTDDPYRNRYPRWSPDGRRIAFSSNRGGTYNIWTISVDGAGLEPLMNTPRHPRSFPVWSPDGTRLAFLEFKPDQRTTYIVSLSESAPIAEPIALKPPGETADIEFTPVSWSRDGSMLAGTYIRAGVSDGIGIYTFASKSYSRLTETGHTPEWLADSRRILFVDQDAIHLLDIVTKDRREILNSEQVIGHAGFTVSPDNRQIYVTVDTSETDIWVADLE